MNQLKFILFFISIIGLHGFDTIKDVSPKPNIIIILMDDLGYGDISCYGALQYQTPNIDQMANEGIRFTNYLSAQAVCSASRAALLTGCYPNRIGFSGALMPDSKIGINANETTMAEMLKQKGYATAIVGKWHLGRQKKFLPLQHGFDQYFGLPYSNDMWPVGYDGNPALPNQRQFNYPTLPLIKDNEILEEIKTKEDQSFLTRRYTEQALEFIKKNKKNPFFLYLPHSMPHVPIAVSSKFKGKSKQGLYGDVMMEMDWSVGQILKTLKEYNLDKNTVVIFTSDNGPWINFGNHAGSAGGFREAKGTSFEGGVRVPCIVRWKGTIQRGQICNKLVSSIDLFPTIADICQVSLPSQKIDGVDILPLLQGKDVTPRRYFYYYYDKNNLKAVRRDDWKLMLPHLSQSYEKYPPGNNGFPGTTIYDFSVPLSLYDLRRDPSERYDVKALYPEIVEELLKIAENAREDLGDDLTNRVGKNVRKVGTEF